MACRLKSLLSLVTLGILLITVTALRAGGESIKQPDIVFILLDDLRWDALGYMDHPFVETPNIDRLRAKGAMLQNAFVTTSICCPSRATFLTGTLANQHGVIDNETSEYNPEVTPPLTKYLQEAGYRTAMIGKWHMGNSGAPRPHFDYWLSFKGQGVYNDPLFNINGKKIQHTGYTTDLLTDYAIDFIEQQPEGQPYFCMLSHKAVHEPFQPAPRHTNAFGSKTTTPEPASWSEDFADKPDWHKRQRTRDVRWHYRTREYETEVLPETVPLERWKKSNKYVKQYRCLAAVDDGVGKIMEALRRRGTLDKTLIVFTSDNGYFHMEHRRWDKRLAYEESLRIPMVVFYPGHIKAGSSLPQLITNADFAPTILDYAGLPIPPLMQGASMKPLFEAKDVAWRDAVFYEYWKELVHAIPSMTAVRTDRYKLISYPEIEDIDELYDLQNDPHEMNNLVLEPAFENLYSKMKMRLGAAQSSSQWQRNVFPKNLPRVRGPLGMLLDLAVESGTVVDRTRAVSSVKISDVAIQKDSYSFDGRGSVIKIPFSPRIDPAAWPFLIDVEVKSESDGVIAVQSTPGYGYKLFVQDGRPGIAVHCKTWIDTTTVIDAPQSIKGEWSRLQVLIDYNQLQLIVDGELAERVSLPLPFKGSPKTPLVIGNRGSHPVVAGVPDTPFKGSLRNFSLLRALNP
jgi:N-acetylglucosamine-6-sulfatase